MNTSEKLSKTLNDFIDDFNEQLKGQKNIAIDLDDVIARAFSAGAKAAAALTKTATAI